LVSDHNLDEELPTNTIGPAVIMVMNIILYCRILAVDGRP
jgi:hypothetical protein